MKIGDKAPEFCLKDASEKDICLKDFRGKKVVIYFYPRDNTPGCTVEAIDFSALKKDFEEEGVRILGISKDSTKSHQNFIDKKKLSITLLSDVGSEVQKKYGVWIKKKFVGSDIPQTLKNTFTIGGTIRSTFVIDEKGKIVKIWKNVKVKDHAQEVLDFVRGI